MKVEIKKQQFIQLRIEGKSFEEIAKVLSTTKNHLIQWNKESETRTAINEGLAIHLNDTVRTLEMGKQARLTAMIKTYKKVIEEIEKREFSDISTDKLIQLSVLLNSRINEQNGTIEIGDNSGYIKFDTGDYFNLNTLE